MAWMMTMTMLMWSLIQWTQCDGSNDDLTLPMVNRMGSYENICCPYSAKRMIHAPGARIKFEMHFQKNSVTQGNRRWINKMLKSAQCIWQFTVPKYRHRNKNWQYFCWAPKNTVTHRNRSRSNQNTCKHRPWLTVFEKYRHSTLTKKNSRPSIKKYRHWKKIPSRVTVFCWGVLFKLPSLIFSTFCCWEHQSDSNSRKSDSKKILSWVSGYGR